MLQQRKNPLDERQYIQRKPVNWPACLHAGGRPSLYSKNAGGKVQNWNLPACMRAVCLSISSKSRDY